MTAPVLVLGAGYVGSALVAELAAAGVPVVAVRRHARPDAPAPGIQVVSGDAREPASLSGLPPRIAHVVLCAAPSGGSDHATTYPPLARAAVWLAQHAGAESVVYTSSTGVYGVRNGREVTEDTPRQARGPDGEALVAAEDTVLGAAGLRSVVLRVAGIYGPGRSAMARFRDASRLSAGGAYWTNFAHRDDIVAAVRLALGSPSMRGAYNCADGSPMLAIHVARELARLEGRPWSPPAVGADDAPPRSNQRISNTRLVAAGFAPRYPSIREGFAALLAADGAASH
ncbi:MAG: NAD-dependent epimerase/dehydratase family protein [Gemmatimonadaceae bacterium]|nr:NAD-dependent epimerase/dehydratase family protein [Gemmatimonadaceae bacterium]